tara:strand:+ start:181 stop:939 length:759 start_codon:yes stop_codon:yes gene_type:complete
MSLYKGKLLSIGSNPKINKSDKSGKGFKTAILHLSPYKLSGKNFCPNASKGCIEGCLNTSGHGRFDKTQEARLKRSHFFIKDKFGFMKQLSKEIEAFEKHCKKRNLKPAIRLNGTSDIPWENIKFEVLRTKPNHQGSCVSFELNIFQRFSNVQFYDYTKSKKRALSETLPKNYDLTFSRSEKTLFDDIWKMIYRLKNVAVVFKSFVPDNFEGLPVINGDNTDLRFLDPKGFIIGLSAKGKAKKDTSGFVIQN